MKIKKNRIEYLKKNSKGINKINKNHKKNIYFV